MLSAKSLKDINIKDIAIGLPVINKTSIYNQSNSTDSDFIGNVSFVKKLDVYSYIVIEFAHNNTIKPTIVMHNTCNQWEVDIERLENYNK